MSLNIYESINYQSNCHEKPKIPTLTGIPAKDVSILRTFNKKTLQHMSDNDFYVMHLCNDDAELYHIITAPPAPLR